MKISKILLSATVLTALSACSSELDVPDNGSNDGDEVVVTYSVTVPEGIQSRAFSDGTKACNLHYAVYEVESGDAESAPAEASSDVADLPTNLKPCLSENTKISGSHEDIHLHLIKGKKYDVIFWAQSDDAPFSYKDATQTVTFDYDNATANSDDLDAFYAHEYISSTESLTKQIILKRPFAQINIGTNDVAEARKMNLRVDRTTITTNACTKFYVKKELAYDEDEVTFRLADVPDNENFPVDGVESYIAMNYILAPEPASGEENAIVDVVLNIDDKFETKFENIPVKRNYRTNIYGDCLITNPSNFYVVINPEYDGTESYKDTTWDGKSIGITVNEDGIFEISTPAQLKRISEAAAKGATFEDETFQLTADIDLNGEAWTPISYNPYGSYGDSSYESSFKGTFDGNGHTIKNIHIDGDYDYSGFFGFVEGATIKDLTLENVVINNEKTGTTYIGGLAGACINATISGIKIKGLVKINSEHVVGGLFGLVSSSKISDITIEAEDGSIVTATNADSAGGVIGYYSTSGSLSNITSNLNVTAESYSTGNSAAHVGGIIGRAYTTITLENCTSSGKVILINNLSASSTPNPYNMTIGGLVGSLKTDNTATFKNCSFSGSLASYYGDSEVTDLISNAYYDEDNDYYVLYNGFWPYIGWWDNGTPVGSKNKVTYTLDDDNATYTYPNPLKVIISTD